MTDRSFYLSDFADECLPCEPTLDGWAVWLNGPDPDWQRGAAATDGSSFAASAIIWSADIIAHRSGGAWTLSRAPAEDDFVAVRYGEGLGWSADNIISQNLHYDTVSGTYLRSGTMESALLAWLLENDFQCDDVEFVAVGQNEQGWRITFDAGDPPSCSAERVQ